MNIDQLENKIKFDEIFQFIVKRCKINNNIIKLEKNIKEEEKKLIELDSIVNSGDTGKINIEKFKEFFKNYYFQVKGSTAKYYVQSIAIQVPEWAPKKRIYEATVTEILTTNGKQVTSEKKMNLFNFLNYILDPSIELMPF